MTTDTATLFTRREMQVLQLLAEGLHNNEIARHLNISEHTAKFHVNAVLLKTNQNTRLGAVVYCLKLGLLNIKDLMPEVNLAMAKGELALNPVPIPVKENIDDVINKMDNLVNDLQEALTDNGHTTILDDEDKAMIKNIIQQYYPANV